MFSNHNSEAVWIKMGTFDYIKIKLYITKYMGKIKGQMENCKNEFVIYVKKGYYLQCIQYF